MLTLALLALTADSAPLSLASPTTTPARRMNSPTITVTLSVGKLPFTWNGGTVIGAGDQPDGVERGVVLKDE